MTSIMHILIALLFVCVYISCHNDCLSVCVFSLGKKLTLFGLISDSTEGLHGRFVHIRRTTAVLVIVLSLEMTSYRLDMFTVIAHKTLLTMAHMRIFPKESYCYTLNYEKTMLKRCITPGCSTSNGKGYSFHTFPHDESIQQNG